MDTKVKPPCKFGVKCYRKNPKHFEIYSHAKESNGKSEFKFLSDKKEACAQKELFNSKLNRGIILKKRKIIQSNSKKGETSNCFKNYSNDDEDNKDSFGSNEETINDYESVQSSSQVFSKSELRGTEISSDFVDLKNKTRDELIKILFLVDMPPDFYSFYKFCKSLNKNNDLKCFQLGELKLVGPFDILSEEVNYAVNPELFLCHWRFYFDPPEFQTVLATSSGFHIGYWRDDPNECPVFLASNNPNKDCIFKIEGENIFGVVYHYLDEFIKSCDPYNKIKIAKLKVALSDWADQNKFSLKKKWNKINARQKKVLSKTFHGAGIVVPLDAETKLGYRPLLETDENLKKICKLIIKASDEKEKESLWENLQPLITAANIANDECDFGNSLELGINLFCMGSAVFHNTIEHLLSTAYFLLNRAEFAQIIKTHLKFRRKGDDMSMEYNWQHKTNGTATSSSVERAQQQSPALPDDRLRGLEDRFDRFQQTVLDCLGRLSLSNLSAGAGTAPSVSSPGGDGPSVEREVICNEKRPMLPPVAVPPLTRGKARNKRVREQEAPLPIWR